ncbi:MAG: hypothetical protein M3437_01290, partial [Chloroflexota bacterium]|nr:hypothetical protein [Chloroflexota bacterium]
VTWCKADPVVRLNGTLVDVQIAIPPEYQLLVNGPTRFEIQTPRSVIRALYLSDPGFNLQGIQVDFVTNQALKVEGQQFQTRIKVTVPIDTTQLPPGAVVAAELTVLPHNQLQPVVVMGTSDLTMTTLWLTGQ